MADKAASVLARLQNKANETGRSYQFSVDFGFGDTISPKQEKRAIPTQLDDFVAPIIGTYSYDYFH
jgi:hypothetical protein